MSLKVLQVSVGWLTNLQKDNWGALKVHLFVNDKQILDGDKIDDYAEANFDGYGPVDTAQWTDAVVAADGVHWQTQAVAVNFNHTGGPMANDVYGYYTSRPSGLGAAREIVWAERLANPPVHMALVGDFLTIVPTYQYRSEF